MTFKTPVSTLGFVYKAKKSPLEKLGILTLKDLLYYPPVRYETYPEPKKIRDTSAGEDAVVEGRVAVIKNQYLRSKKSIQKAVIWDESGEIECVWFNQVYLLKVIREGDILRVAGKVSLLGTKRSINVKEYEQIIEGKKPLHVANLVPIYSETRRLSSKWIRNRIFEQINSEVEYEDVIPEKYRIMHNLITVKESVEALHFPKRLEETEKAKLRFSYEEILVKHLASLRIKKDWDANFHANKFQIEKHRKEIERLIKSVSFDLTDSQTRSIEDIFADLQKGKPMNRLLEGDVGSGKTIVAAISAFISYLNGFQTAVMAPTGILANQHYKTFEALLKPIGIKIELFTSSTKGSNKFDVAIGTHALIHKKADFKNLGLVVIDEQQRFGVVQRAILREKGNAPHVLTMTATPIPRTILLTAYGNLDVSLLDEMPKNRKKVKTWFVPNEKRDKAYDWIKEKIKKGDQVFVVCPFIEPSESKNTVKAASEEFERLKKDVFTNSKLGLLHGRMKQKEKDETLNDFKEKRFDILVTTPVVEVGIDIPNATVMLIEGAERFGLSQLHQMRGRVGRGVKESFCLLFSDNLNFSTEKRLRSLEKVYSGPELAEIDLQMRGPGNIYGTNQHGRLVFKFASIFDKSLISMVKRDALEIIKDINKYKLLRDAVESTIIQKVSPD